MNLLSEYLKRKRLAAIPPTNEGFCFFNEGARPAAICLTSSAPKCHTTCDLCGQSDDKVTTEFFVPSPDGMLLQSHRHIGPDDDICEVIRRDLPVVTLTPVRIRTGGDIEPWLWQFFLQHNPLRRSRAWVDAVRQLADLAEPMRTNEQMMQAATRHPRRFNYYFALYQNVVVGRKYLVFE